MVGGFGRDAGSGGHGIPLASLPSSLAALFLVIWLIAVRLLGTGKPISDHHTLHNGLHG